MNIKRIIKKKKVLNFYNHAVNIILNFGVNKETGIFLNEDYIFNNNVLFIKKEIFNKVKGYQYTKKISNGCEEYLFLLNLVFNNYEINVIPDNLVIKNNWEIDHNFNNKYRCKNNVLKLYTSKLPIHLKGCFLYGMDKYFDNF
jgi:hypothetical protein